MSCSNVMSWLDLSVKPPISPACQGFSILRSIYPSSVSFGHFLEASHGPQDDKIMSFDRVYHEQVMRAQRMPRMHQVQRHLHASALRSCSGDRNRSD